MNKRIFATLVALVLMLSLAGCGNETKYKAGVYEGEATGYHPETPIKVSVTVSEDGKIQEVRTLSHDETPEIGGEALKELEEAVVEKNSADVDAVSGATMTSKGFTAAVKDALSKAK